MPVISDYLYRKAARNKIPLGAAFELSPVCNFSCRMCYVRKTEAQVRREGKQIKKWTEWLHLAEECKKEGTLYLLLTGGEPFIYPHFKELYMELHKMGFILSINTNGTMIDQETVEWLKKAAPSRVNLTLYGASPQTYKHICGHANGYERAVNAVKMLKEAGIPIVLNCSLIPENADDMEEIIRFGKILNLNVRAATYMFPPVRRGQEANDSRFSPEYAAEMYLRKQRCLMESAEYITLLKNQMEELETETSENVKNNGNMKLENIRNNGNIDSDDGEWGNYKEYMKCRAGRCSFWVSWDGTMTACGLMPFPVQTNPFEVPFRDCWQELTEYVRKIPVLKGCAECSRKNICKPCVAMLYAETGDANKKAPYMCEMTEYIIEKTRLELKKMEGVIHESEK